MVDAVSKWHAAVVKERWSKGRAGRRSDACSSVRGLGVGLDAARGQGRGLSWNGDWDS